MDKRVRNFYESLGYTDPKMYDYFDRHVTYANMDSSNDNSIFVGCFYNSSGNILSSIHTVLPYGKDLKYLSQQVHEVAHFISLYPYLNKNFDDSASALGMEIFPIAMERLFAEKTNDPAYLEWFNNYQKEIINQTIKSNSDSHIIGFLNHWDYLEFYRETNILPELIDYKINTSIDLKKELSKKVKDVGNL